ncbi:hypothetical protein ACWERV_00505 [Streptomyces sp. NPDC004031]
MTRRTVVVRGTKGTLVSAAAATADYTVWHRLVEWSDDVSAAASGAMGAGWSEALLALAVGLTSMPVLLWAGMRLLGERGNHLLILAGTPLWWLIGARAVGNSPGPAATVLLLTLFTLLAGLLSLPEVPATTPPRAG